MTAGEKSHIIAGLQTDILRMQGFKPASSLAVNPGLGPILSHFPNASFPVACVHEFLWEKTEDAAASKAFISGLIASLMGKSGISIWVSASRTVFPPGLRAFGIYPDQFIFVDVKKDIDILWALEEALKCGAVSTVVGEMRDLSFTTSRRFQLAVEESQVTGFILRNSVKKVKTTACLSRWKITSVLSESIDDLPGLGYPRWKVELLRIRNGRPGAWEFQWVNGNFQVVNQPAEDAFNLLKISDSGVDMFFHNKKAG